jgi:hypothetical protein
LKLKIDKARNVHGNECYPPLKLSLIPPGYEAMYLVRNTIAYFDKPAQELNNAQLDALQNLNTWMDTGQYKHHLRYPPPFRI